ncbi:zinc-dependent metalloprotease family protein [Pricia sp. S334]|uniref:Zinc-dependent metalloprotease family protein n=1 Tax=Pricia mediterranea TaxID=3076079 RepID=A0ABU3L3Y2_9FLAO|nr:zinc-dependent metalloprotease family protein [Pricia sp. S334]MDT7828456.1 zinc-dependent metalloprotease family protein [Pricia sp. S334]
MLAKLRLLFSITIVFLSFYASAQGQYWERKTARNDVSKKITERFEVKKSDVFSFREAAFRLSLTSTSRNGKSAKIIHFPDGEGEFTAFRVVESPVLSPALSQKYPGIKSYVGQGVDNPNVRVRFSMSPKNIQAMIVHSDGRDTRFVQKVSGDTYVMYSRSSENQVDSDFICHTQDKLLARGNNLTAKPVDGQVLRRYRLAIAASAEYTEFHGGTVADALAAINATITRVNEVFETDLAVTLQLVGETDATIYTDAETDPFRGSLSALGNEGQSAMTDQIGPANYDIGHVFHQGANGGNAGFIGAICVDNQKGQAYSSSQSPQGDIFDLDFVAHEMGHQLGANHSWSYEWEGTPVQVEPGSGSTIMGYAGITDQDDVVPNGDDYFHYVSIDQIIENLKTKDCGQVVPLSNNPPVVNALADHVIPKSTAFVLTGSATDSDAGDVLTYTWEQIDNGIVKEATFGPTNPNGANFRSRPPMTEPTRYFPLLSRIVQGQLTETNPTLDTEWETVSEVERELNFAFTVRDNAPGGGQVVSELVKVSVTNEAGPFSVTSQAVGEIYTAGEAHEILWNVANTDAAPVNAESVDIFLSTDGGESFPITLAEAVPNDGAEEIVFPGQPTEAARIMVKAADNIFLAVNASNFTIQASEIVLNLADLDYEVCQSQDLNIPFVYETYLGFSEEVSFGMAGLPAGLQVSFSPSTATAGDIPVNILLENTGSVPEGNYEVLLTATSASATKQIGIRLAVFDTDFPAVVLQSPADGATDVSKWASLEWEGGPAYSSYDIQIATDAAFTDIVETETIASNSYTAKNLENESTYFWRIKPSNACGEGVFSAQFGFTTLPVNCDAKSAYGPPTPIASNRELTITSTIAFFEDLRLADINVNLNLDHDYLEDLRITLTSPLNTTVSLVANSCGDLRNINATFDDDAAAFECGAVADTGISGTVKPSGSLDSFEGESILGEWVLEIQDISRGDGGTLNNFSLDVCVEDDFRPDADRDGVFDDGDDLCPGTPEGVEVDTSGCPIYRFPSDNFLVSVESLSCRGNDDGEIRVEAVLLDTIDYGISITGDGTAITDTFTDRFTASNLPVGTYTVCIDGSDVEIEYEGYCFEVVVTQPEPLAVTASLAQSGKQVVLALAGADVYTIILNGRALRTEKSEITLDLATGKNGLKVSTDMVCQGVYQNQFVVSNGPTAFPNPFRTDTHLFLGAVEERVTIAIFTVDGQWVREEVYTPSGNQVNLDFMGLPQGVYVVKFEGDNVKGTIKVIKR